VIQSAPSVIQYGQSFQLSFTSSTASNRVVLIRNSCATHSVNMDQRYVRLADLRNGRWHLYSVRSCNRQSGAARLLHAL
jgi:hypothetical protein